MPLPRCMQELSDAEWAMRSAEEAALGMTATSKQLVASTARTAAEQQGKAAALHRQELRGAGAYQSRHEAARAKAMAEAEEDAARDQAVVTAAKEGHSKAAARMKEKQLYLKAMQGGGACLCGQHCVCSINPPPMAGSTGASCASWHQHTRAVCSTHQPCHSRCSTCSNACKEFAALQPGLYRMTLQPSRPAP